ncbi:terminase large subunit [Salmonella phage SPFM8]|nr:terminase large subunit [Salmonella phage SPFM8]
MYKNRIQALVSQLNTDVRNVGQIETMIRQSQVVADPVQQLTGEFDEEAAVEEEEKQQQLMDYGISNSRLMMRNRNMLGGMDLVISWLLAMWLLLFGNNLGQILGLVERNGRIDHRASGHDVFTTALRLSADLLRSGELIDLRKYIGFSTDQDKRRKLYGEELYKEFHRGPVGSPERFWDKFRDLHRRLYVKVTQDYSRNDERRSTGSSVADAIILQLQSKGFAIHLADFMIEYPNTVLILVNSVTAEYAGKLTVNETNVIDIIGLDTSEAVGRDAIAMSIDYVTDWYYTEEQMLVKMQDRHARRMNASRIRAAQKIISASSRDFGGEWTTGGYNKPFSGDATDEELADMIANAPGTPDQIPTAKIPRIMFYVKYNHRQLGNERYIDIPTRAQLIDMIRKGYLATEEGEYMYSLMTSGISWGRINEAEGVPYGNVFATTPGAFTNNIHHILPAALASGTAAQAANGVGRGLTAGRLFSDEGPFACLAQGNKLITGIGQNDKGNALPDYLWPHHPDDPDNREILITKGPALREETINKMKQLPVGMSALLLWLMRFLENSRTNWIFFNNIDAAIEFLRQHGKTADGVKNGMPFRLDRGNFSMLIVTECAENPWYFFRECVRVHPELRGVDPFSPDLTLEQKAIATTLQGLGVQHWYVHLALHRRHYPGAIVDDVTPNVHFLQFPPPLRGWRYGDCMILRKNDYGYA